MRDYREGLSSEHTLVDDASARAKHKIARKDEGVGKLNNIARHQLCSVCSMVSVLGIRVEGGHWPRPTGKETNLSQYLSSRGISETLNSKNVRMNGSQE